MITFVFHLGELYAVGPVFGWSISVAGRTRWRQLGCFLAASAVVHVNEGGGAEPCSVQSQVFPTHVLVISVEGNVLFSHHLWQNRNQTLIHVKKETVNILPVVPVCSSGNICGHQEWDTREQRPYEPSSGASLLWTQWSRKIPNMCPGRFLGWFPFVHMCTVTCKRLEFHKAATTAAVQDSVLGQCWMSLAMTSDFGYTITFIVQSVKRTQSHLKSKKLLWDWKMHTII